MVQFIGLIEMWFFDRLELGFSEGEIGYYVVLWCGVEL